MLGDRGNLTKTDGRPEFLDFNFDGNTEEEKEKQTKRQIHQQYCQELPTSLSHDRHYRIEQALLAIPDSAWSSVDELSIQVELHIKGSID